MTQCRYGVIASLSAAGTPQSALVGIAVTPALEVIFDTVKSSRKYANLGENPQCSLVIGWDSEQTLQLEGTAIEPSGADLARYQQIYFATWPDGPSRLDWPGIAYFVIRPFWVRFSDFAESPPMIFEQSFPR